MTVAGNVIRQWFHRVILGHRQRRTWMYGPRRAIQCECDERWRFVS
ncbi:hypothetical protein QC999_gp14 [Microbacterium phage Cressida]|uniref:Uncharacterized protein n=1 Tax=Microbacterium phage Cressida TaxID=2591216 RepID=A0A514DI85_9CAUD|nr:hypothetical protein QC999_gp14 [Microbacterium phage Cressida]QDH93336.1 hypothetical protein PBI_CRESSIDA_94 [Microbacterium phage Cressida]